MPEDSKNGGGTATAERPTQDAAQKDGQNSGQSENREGGQNPQAAAPPNQPDAKPDEKKDDKPPKPHSRRAWIQPVAMLAGIVAAIFLIIWGINYFRYAAAHTSTDDAYMTSDVVQITPQISGNIAKVLVGDNQHVKAGDVIAIIEDSTYRANVAQAKANLLAAQTAAQSAGANVSLTNATGAAQIEQATGGLNQAESGIGSAQADVTRARAAIRNAQANTKTAQSNVNSAVAAVQAAVAARNRAVANVAGAQAQVTTAAAGVQAAQANVSTAQANADKAAKDEQRYAVLFQQDAVSAQVVDQAHATAVATRSQQDAAQQAVSQAQAMLEQKRADLDAAKEAVRNANAQIEQARSQLAAARDTVVASQTMTQQMQAQLQASQQNVVTARGKRQQAAGTLNQAKTAPQQVNVSRANQQTAQAKIAEAQATLDTAIINLNDTKITAPVDGVVSKKTVQIGQQVSVGQALMSLVPDNDLWVVGNFKETQLKNVRAGQKAEIEVDTLPGIVFKGHVDSLSAGTGATFALLPADNATGNFTKVVQRVPVKILLEPNQKNSNRLRSGLSVIATITTD